MLSREYGKHNKGRNRILTCAVCLCIVTLGMVFGITTGKAEAEYIKSAREAGTTASACIEGAGSSHYQKVRSLGYVKRSGRRVMVGWAADVDADRTSDNLTAPFATEGGAQEESGKMRDPAVGCACMGGDHKPCVYGYPRTLSKGRAGGHASGVDAESHGDRRT